MKKFLLSVLWSKISLYVYTAFPLSKHTLDIHVLVCHHSLSKTKQTKMHLKSHRFAILPLRSII